LTGATFINIFLGHAVDFLQSLLGKFTSVSATTASVGKGATVKETGEKLTLTGEDHVAFSGLLDTGVFASVSAKAGYPEVPGARFLWEIQGTEGLIRLVDNPEEAQVPTLADTFVYLNGDLVPLEGGGKGGLAHNVATEWAEFAKGKDGDYPTLDQAVKLHELLDAIRKSAAEGVKVNINL
jgi:predicted dehydrogenase